MTLPQNSDVPTESLQPRLLSHIAYLENLLAEAKQGKIEPDELLATEWTQGRIAAALYQASLVLNSSLNYEEVLDRILDQLHPVIPHDAASIMLIEGDTAHTVRWRGYNQFLAEADWVPLHFNISHTSTFQTMWQTGRPLVIPSVATDRNWVTVPETSWIRSYLGAPICIRGQVVGFINLSSSIPDFFGPADLKALQAFAELTAIALGNAQSYDQRRREVMQQVRALKRERNFISAVLDEVGALVMILTRQGRIVRFNRACEQTTGYSFEEVKGKYWWDVLLPAEEVETIRAEFNKLGLDQPSQRNERYWITKAGQRRLIVWSNTVLLGHKGEVEYILHSAVDLTERKQIEEALRETRNKLEQRVEERTLELSNANAILMQEIAERKRAELILRDSEERFRQVISSIADHIYMSKITEDGRHSNLYLSPNIEKLTGYPVEEFMVDASFWPEVVIHPDDRELASAQLEFLRTNRKSEVEYRLIKANGEMIWVRDSAEVQLKDGVRIIYGVVSDITRRKEAEIALLEERALLAQRVAERTADLSQANAALARAGRLKDEFLASMSHELRTPLNVILGMAEVLRLPVYGSLNQDQLNSLGFIEEGGRHLLALINDILDLSKIEADKLDLVITQVFIKDICEASLRLIGQMAQNKRIKVSLDLDERVTTLPADERRLKQILVNLLTNAVKFTREGGQIGLEVTADETLDMVHFSVWDTGIGISAEDIQHLFQPFVQLDSRLARQYDGTGLGLALVSRLSEMHGGGVSVESEVNVGSRFTVSLPRSINLMGTAEEAKGSGKQGIRPGQEEKKHSSSDPSDQALSSPLVLLAEDNEANSITLSDFLEANGYRVIVARNGLEALEQARKALPVAILMDVQMPMMDGLEAIERIRNDELPGLAAVPIIAVTALAMPGDQEKCLKAGADAYLSKPFSLRQLLEMIKTLV